MAVIIVQLALIIKKKIHQSIHSKPNKSSKNNSRYPTIRPLKCINKIINTIQHLQLQQLILQRMQPQSKKPTNHHLDTKNKHSKSLKMKMNKRLKINKYYKPTNHL